MRPQEALDICVTVQGREYRATAPILEMRYFELLLGNDLLHQMKRLVIDYVENCVSIEPVPEKDLKNKVRVLERVDICPGTTRLVKLQADLDPDKDYVLEPSLVLFRNKGLTTGKTLVSGNIAMIYVTNFGSQLQPLEINTCLAVATEVDKIGPTNAADPPRGRGNKGDGDIPRTN
jgi:hypothetical protein